MRVQTGRSMRAFRIVRLFRRVKSLRNIVMALTSSIVPVINAYFVLLVAMCICVYHPASFISFYFLSFYFLSHAALLFFVFSDSIMGVTFYSNVYPEYFAVFDRGLITMFRITSGEPWGDILPPTDETGAPNPGNCLFIVSYLVIVCWTLLQVQLGVKLLYLRNRNKIGSGLAKRSSFGANMKPVQ